MSTTYRVYKDPSKENGTNITAPLSLNVQDISRDTIYEELKIIYPDSIDCE